MISSAFLRAKASRVRRLIKSLSISALKLNAKGIETEPVRFDIFTNKKMTFFSDPDGLPLEIHE